MYSGLSIFQYILLVLMMSHFKNCSCYYCKLFVHSPDTVVVAPQILCPYLYAPWLYDYIPLRSIDGQSRVDNTYVQQRGPAEKVAIWPVKSHSFYIMHLSIKNPKTPTFPSLWKHKNGQKTGQKWPKNTTFWGPKWP